MISIEVDGEDYALNQVVSAIKQALGDRVVAVVELNKDGLLTADTAIKDAIMEKYREFMDMLAKPNVAIEAAITAVAKERGMTVIKIKAPAKALWVLYM
jgi:hypothetical protein